MEEKSKNEKLSTVISIVALIVSIFSAVFSFRMQSTDFDRSTRDQLSTTVRELIRLKAENSFLFSVAENERDANFYQRSSTIVHTAAALSRQAVFLAEQRRELVSDVEFVTIAQGLAMAGDMPLAERYFKAAIEKSANDFYRIANTRTYAEFLMYMGKHQQAREHYQSALNIVPNDSDFNKLNNAYTYQMWMLSEANQRMWEEAERNYHTAKQIIESVSSPEIRENSLRSLELARKGVYTPQSSNSIPSVGPPGQNRNP